MGSRDHRFPAATPGNEQIHNLTLALRIERGRRLVEQTYQWGPASGLPTNQTECRFRATLNKALQLLSIYGRAGCCAATKFTGLVFGRVAATAISQINPPKRVMGMVKVAG